MKQENRSFENRRVFAKRQQDKILTSPLRRPDDGLTPAVPEDVRRQNFVKAKAFTGIGTRAFRVLAEAMPQSPGAARTALRHGGRSESVPPLLLYRHDSSGMIRAFRKFYSALFRGSASAGHYLDARQNFSAPAAGAWTADPHFFAIGS